MPYGKRKNITKYNKNTLNPIDNPIALTKKPTKSNSYIMFLRIYKISPQILSCSLKGDSR